MQLTRTKNFTLKEVAHRYLPAELTINGVAAMQALQLLRDMGSEHFGKDVPLKIISGYRDLQYNTSINSPSSSYHIWRKETDGTLIWAVDFVPVGVDIAAYFEWMQHKVSGERYRHSRYGFIHFAPNGRNKPPWVQR